MNVLGLMRVKNESRWIRQSIESQLTICSKVVVLDDHSTDDTRDIVRSFGEKKTMLVESPFEGVSEGRDKRYLLDLAIVNNPDWALWIDGDEVLEKKAAEIFSDELTHPTAWYSLRVLYFWDGLDKVRTDGVYARLARPSLFRVRGQDATRLHFPVGNGAADLHNGGNCPQGLVGAGYLSRARIKHYGYLDREERQRKYDFYNRIDPGNVGEDCYRHIIEVPGAIHAPGPTVLENWTEE